MGSSQPLTTTRMPQENSALQANRFSQLAQQVNTHNQSLFLHPQNSYHKQLNEARKEHNQEMKNLKSVVRDIEKETNKKERNMRRRMLTEYTPEMYQEHVPITDQLKEINDIKTNILKKE